MSTYAIGDIHGCFTALKTLFDQHDFNKEDTLVFLGDYVDRGENVKGSIDFLLQKKEEMNCIFIQGNHELMMIAAKENEERFGEWYFFGGEETLASYGFKEGDDWEELIGSAHWNFIETALPYHEVDDIIFVHAGLEPGISLSEQTKHHLFWQKYVEPEAYLEGKTVISGHTSRRNGIIADFKHTICIDTYAYGDMWLSCLNVDTLEYVQTNNFGQYQRGILER